jgi:diguanylate cyclase (GGDEF)-like protein/PAS domain S-box-containing protein
METPLVVVACSVFKPELTALADQGRLPFRVRFTDSGLHMYPERLQTELESLIQEERSSGAEVLLVYGDCSTRMADLTVRRGIVRTAGTNCGEIFLGKARHKELVKSRAFLLLPEWAERWKEILLRLPGADAELARTIVRDLHSRFVYVDTGVGPVPHETLRACSAFFDRPHEVLEAGAERFENTIRQAVDRLPRSAADEVESLGKTRATAVMMLDIVTATLEHSSGLSGVALALCQKLRALTGAKVSALVVPTAPGGSSTRTGHRVLAVSPARHAGLLQNDAVRALFEQSLEAERTVTLLPNEQGHRDAGLTGLLPALVMPLRSGSERVGALLSLGLLDASFVDSVMEIERILSGAMSVVLRNALLREDQRQLVQALEREVVERKQAEETLKSSEAHVRLLLDSTAEAIYGIDLEGNCTFVNPAGLRLLGYSEPTDLLGRNMHRLIHHSSPDGTPMAIEQCDIYRAFRVGQGTHRDDEVLWKRDGTSFPVEYWSHPQLVGGKVVGAVVAFIDITQRRRFQRLLELEQQRLAFILEGTNVGTWEWNVQTGETVFNERWAEIIGHTLGELSPISIETWSRLAHPEDLKVSGHLLEKHFRRELPYYELEARMRHKDSSWVWVLDRGKVAVWSEDGKPLMMYGTHQDITARKLAEEEIRHLATHDALTGLPSLRLAKDRLSMAVHSAHRNKTLAAAMFIDLDGFKAVNDHLGHEAGDAVLAHVARVVGSNLRETDTFARIGGDEFLLVAADLKLPEGAKVVARRILDLLSAPMQIQGEQVSIGASIGIALYPKDGQDPDRLIKAADAAMYEVKKRGKNGYGLASGPG